MAERVVTFLLTEVPDSIRRWEDNEAAMTAATEQLDDIVLRVVAEHAGTQVKPRGEGDSYFLVFETPADAVACAVALQRAAHDEVALPMRTATHVGPAEIRGGDWYGTTVNRCARLRAAAHSGQSLVSAAVADAFAAEGGPPEGITLRSLGRHRLKDLDEPAEVFQVVAAGLVQQHPSLITLAQSHGLPLPRSSFVGREGEVERALAELEKGRVVAVTGPPGVGTTRLALETAARWWNRAQRAVRVLDPTASAHMSTARLEPGELVLVDDADPLTMELVGGPAIVTGRGPVAAVAITGLRLHPLDPFESERLFKDRLSDDTAVPVSLVRFCDGLPLAIELLARRAESVDATVLAERLAIDPLAVLGGDRRAEPARHSSIRTTLAAAFDRLTDAEQRDLLRAAPGDASWVDAGWHEPHGPLPLVAAFLAQRR